MRFFKFSIIILLATACGNTNSNNTSNNESNKNNSSNNTKKVKKAKIGESISNSSFASVTLLKALRVDKFQKGPGTRRKKASERIKNSPKGKDFLLIKVNYKNIGENKLQIGHVWSINNIMKISESSDRPFGTVLYHYSTGNGPKEDMVLSRGNRLKQGESTSGWLFMKIPEELKDFDVSYMFRNLMYDKDGDGEFSTKDAESNVKKAVWEIPDLKEYDRINFTHKEKDYKIPGKSD